MACLFGHKWNGCKCEKCGKLRNEGHDYAKIPNTYDEKCNICGNTRKISCTYHNWKGCQCVECGAKRDEKHDYKLKTSCKYLVVCSICGAHTISLEKFDDGTINAEVICMSMYGNVYSTLPVATQNVYLTGWSGKLNPNSKYMSISDFSYVYMGLKMFESGSNDDKSMWAPPKNSMMSSVITKEKAVQIFNAVVIKSEEIRQEVEKSGL